jgi:hypothetical protein
MDLRRAEAMRLRTMCFLVFPLVAGCASTSETKSAPISPSQNFCIPDEELPTHLSRARAGSTPEMNDLYMHYIGCWGNRELGFYWAARAAELCDLEMQDEVETWFSFQRNKAFEPMLAWFKQSWEKCSGNPDRLD